MRQPVGSELVAALERAWGAIAKRHPGVPAAVVIVGSGSEGRRRGLRLGHFAASRWSADPGAPSLGEVFVAGEGLDRGPADVFGTLLHEAAHALAHARGVQDTSRQGRYHNRRFAQLAGELGLQVEHHPQLGWSLTSVRAPTAIVYGPALAELKRALIAHRFSELRSPPRSPARNGAVAMCACGRRIRIAPAVLALGPVLCGVCAQPFTPVVLSTLTVAPVATTSGVSAGAGAFPTSPSSSTRVTCARDGSDRPLGEGDTRSRVAGRCALAKAPEVQ